MISKIFQWFADLGPNTGPEQIVEKFREDIELDLFKGLKLSDYSTVNTILKSDLSVKLVKLQGFLSTNKVNMKGDDEKLEKKAFNIHSTYIKAYEINYVETVYRRLRAEIVPEERDKVWTWEEYKTQVYDQFFKELKKALPVGKRTQDNSQGEVETSIEPPQEQVKRGSRNARKKLPKDRLLQKARKQNKHPPVRAKKESPESPTPTKNTLSKPEKKESNHTKAEEVLPPESPLAATLNQPTAIDGGPENKDSFPAVPEKLDTEALRRVTSKIVVPEIAESSSKDFSKKGNNLNQGSKNRSNDRLLQGPMRQNKHPPVRAKKESPDSPIPTKSAVSKPEKKESNHTNAEEVLPSKPPLAATLNQPTAKDGGPENEDSVPAIPDSLDTETPLSVTSKIVVPEIAESSSKDFSKKGNNLNQESKNRPTESPKINLLEKMARLSQTKTAEPSARQKGNKTKQKIRYPIVFKSKAWTNYWSNSKAKMGRDWKDYFWNSNSVGKSYLMGEEKRNKVSRESDVNQDFVIVKHTPKSVTVLMFDGVSQSRAPRQWAEFLAQTYLQLELRITDLEKNDPRVQTWQEMAQERWKNWVEKEYNPRRLHLPAWRLNKEVNASFTTFVAIEINQSMVKIANIGDSAVFCSMKSGEVKHLPTVYDHLLAPKNISTKKLFERDDIEFLTIQTEQIEYLLACTDSIADYVFDDSQSKLRRKLRETTMKLSKPGNQFDYMAKMIGKGPSNDGWLEDDVSFFSWVPSAGLGGEEE